MNTHKELVTNNTGDLEEREVPNGYHYELQNLNDVWQWILVKDSKELFEWLWNKGEKNETEIQKIHR